MSDFDWSKDPLKHLDEIIQEATLKKLPDPNAMSLATVSPTGQPSARIVLFRGFIRDGISFYTNYEGRKSLDISTQPQVCANFFWAPLEKQVQIIGRAEKLSRTESEAYFRGRPRISQLGAWASAQSKEIPSFDFFQQKLAEVEKKFLNQEVPCPPFWGGFLIIPTEVEIWLGRLGRLHERYVYQKMGTQWRHFMRSP